MTHAYITLDTLKGASALNITGTANDDRLLRLAEAASSVIDRWCNRHFFAQRATLRFDGNGEATLGVPDLVSVDSDGVRTYGSGYGAPATVWDADDYNLLPFNADPASVGNPISRPYTRLLATGTGGRSCFPPGRGNVEVSGVWGWWQHLRRASQVVNAAADADATTLTVSASQQDRTEIAAGHTLLIGDEQVYVRASDSGMLTGGARRQRHYDGRSQQGQLHSHLRIPTARHGGGSAACRAHVARRTRRRGRLAGR